MRIELTDEQEMLRSTTRQFLEATSPTTTVREWATSADGFDRSWWKRGAELGWCSLFAPAEYGGGSLSGGPAQDAVILAEELGRAVAPGPFLPVNAVVDALSRSGSSEQCERWLPPLVAGDMVATWVVAGPRGLTAQRVDDGFVLHGEYHGVEAAGAADLLLVSAESDEGAVQCVLPATTDGISRSTMNGLDLVRRFDSVRFEDVRVPRENVLGVTGAPSTRAMSRQRNVALTLQAAESVGAVDRAFEFTFEFMKDRYSYGRPIAAYQALKHAVADMLLQLESAKATTDGAADALDAGDDPSLEVAVAAAYVKQTAVHIIQSCVQILGGIAVTWEHDVHLYLRRATVNRALFGTPDEQREMIATLTT